MPSDNLLAIAATPLETWVAWAHFISFPVTLLWIAYIRFHVCESGTKMVAPSAVSKRFPHIGFVFIAYIIFGFNLHYGFGFSQRFALCLPAGFFTILFYYHLRFGMFRIAMGLLLAGLLYAEAQRAPVTVVGLQVGIAATLAFCLDMLWNWWLKKRGVTVP